MTANAKPRLLVIGGTGFVGSHISLVAARQGFEVTAAGPRSGRLRLDDPEGRVRLLRLDALDRAATVRTLREGAWDYVVNCGGYIGHRLFRDGGRDFLDQHFTALLNIVEGLDRAALKGFVQVGSSDEYGGAPAPQAEDLRESPISPYSLGKVAATHFLQMLSRTEGFPAVTARLFLAYGPGQDRQRFLPQVIEGCLKDAAFPTSAGTQLRDFCWIEDVAAGVLLALRTPASHGQVLNLASGKGVSIRSMIETVCAIVGRGSPEFGRIAYRPGENMALVADVRKAEQLLGWRPTVGLEEGLRRVVAAQQG